MFRQALEGIVKVLAFQVPLHKIEKDAIELVQKIIDTALTNLSNIGDMSMAFEKAPILANSLAFMWQCFDDKSSVGFDSPVHSRHARLGHPYSL